MKMDTFICSECMLAVGGSQTYIFRMMEYMDKQNVRKIIFIWDGEIIADEWKVLIEKYNIEIYFFSQFNPLEIPKSFDGNPVEFRKNENVISITMRTESFINSCFLERKFKHANIRSFYYILHSNLLRLKIDNKHVRKIYKRLALKGILADRLFFMDQYTKGNAENYFGKKLNSPVIRLGMKIPELDETFIDNRINSKVFTILSVSRMAFPFKGYNVGLLEDYIRLKKEYSDIRLVLVGSGEGVIELKNRLNSEPDYIRNDVIFCGTIEYEGLREYFAQANVFVGMGTTVLDAANTGLITVTALAYQKDNYSGGFFHDDVNSIGYIYNKGNEKGNFYDYIKEVYNYDEAKYRECSEKTYALYKEEYDIGMVMGKILNLKTKRKRPGLYEIELYKFIVDMSEIMHI